MDSYPSSFGRIRIKIYEGISRISHKKDLSSKLRDRFIEEIINAVRPSYFKSTEIKQNIQSPLWSEGRQLLICQDEEAEDSEYKEQTEREKETKNKYTLIFALW